MWRNCNLNVNTYLNAKDAHLNNLSQHEIKMGIFFVFVPYGREKSGGGGARGGARAKKAPPRINDFWTFFLILALVLMPSDVFTLV